MVQHNSSSKHAAQYFKQIRANGIALVQHHLVAIYQKSIEPRVGAEQIGTGFLIDRQGRSVLITAKHALYGHNGDENPGEKAIFVGASLKLIGHLFRPEVVRAEDHDLVALYVNEFSQDQCFPSSYLCSVDASPRLVTIEGLLARDFNRSVSTGILSPTPYMYTNSRKDCGNGYIGLRYPKSRNRSTESGNKVMAPIPRGISGGPMLDGAKLAMGRIIIIGVFTDYCQERGMAFGESSTKVLALLARM